MITIKTLYFKFILLAAIFISVAVFTANAQNKTKTIGNKPRSGSANSSFDMVKGNQVGIRMNAGHKPVQLLQLSFSVDSHITDSVRFKVNVYQFDGNTPGEKLAIPEICGAIPNEKTRVKVDLSPYNITVKGHILVTIEWLKTYTGDNHFSIGLFNGGTWRFEHDEWKKTPVAGVDFSVLVKKLK